MRAQRAVGPARPRALAMRQPVVQADRRRPALQVLAQETTSVLVEEPATATVSDP